jgi:hypothetical protein
VAEGEKCHESHDGRPPRRPGHGKSPAADEGGEAADHEPVRVRVRREVEPVFRRAEPREDGPVRDEGDEEGAEPGDDSP